MKRLLSFIFLLAMLFTMTTVAGATEESIYTLAKYSLQGTTQSRYLTGGVPPVRFSM